MFKEISSKVASCCDLLLLLLLSSSSSLLLWLFAFPEHLRAFR